MLVRRWIKRGVISLIGTFVLFYALCSIVPQPWWRKEAGPPPSLFSLMRERATGFFVASDGWLLTNRHATAGCRRVSIGSGTLSGLVADKVLYPTDTQLDLAAVHVAFHPPAFLRLAVTPWPWPASNSTMPNAEVLQDLRSAFSADGRLVSVIGFPGYDHGASPVQLDGELIERATSLDHRHWFQLVRALVRPGSSGSPVIDHNGEVVGIVFRGNIDLPRRPSAADEKKALAALSPSVAQGLIVPAAIADAFMRNVDPAFYGRGEKPADPDAALVRVFCFR